MQTFLPYPDFARSAAVLDRRRLGKQRIEARQILKSLATGGSWCSHPAVVMWRGFEDALALYGNVVIAEWESRGYQNSMELFSLDAAPWRVPTPPWLGDPTFHAAHRSNLLRKDPEWYGQFGWSEKPGLPYIWPR